MDGSFPIEDSRKHEAEIPVGEVLTPEVSIIVPARNEEANLGACLQSLVSQSEVDLEIIVVDDESVDRSREIAQSFGQVRVIAADPLRRDDTGALWSGKNNALVSGTKEARGKWLLFTDADTVHRPGSLRRALKEAEERRADLLSYSPAQVVASFTERAVMPVVFAELAAEYPPEKVRDPHSAIAAANGQYILVRRACYDAVGGHSAIATEILEDVALARKFRDADYSIHFRYGGDAVATRMYRNWVQLRDGWTKNLALLFPQPIALALKSIAAWSAAWFAVAMVVAGLRSGHYVWIAAVAIWLLVYWRIRAAHFSRENNLLAMAFGMPIFSYLVLRSRRAHAGGEVEWKGRMYGTRLSKPNSLMSEQVEIATPSTELKVRN